MATTRLNPRRRLRRRVTERVKREFLMQRPALLEHVNYYHIFEAMQANGIYSIYTTWSDAGPAVHRLVDRLRAELTIPL